MVGREERHGGQRCGYGSWVGRGVSNPMSWGKMARARRGARHRFEAVSKQFGQVIGPHPGKPAERLGAVGRLEGWPPAPSRAMVRDAACGASLRMRGRSQLFVKSVIARIRSQTFGSAGEHPCARYWCRHHRGPDCRTRGGVHDLGPMAAVGSDDQPSGGMGFKRFADPAPPATSRPLDLAACDDRSRRHDLSSP